jgi:predicted dehydrogenase
VSFADGSTTSLARLYDEHCPAARKAREFPFGLGDTFALLQYDWLDAVRRGRAPEISGREGLADLACAYAVLESAQAGRSVEIGEVATGSLCAYQRPIDEHFRIT